MPVFPEKLSKDDLVDFVPKTLVAANHNGNKCRLWFKADLVNGRFWYEIESRTKDIVHRGPSLDAAIELYNKM